MNKLLPLHVLRNLSQPTCWSAAALLRSDLGQVQGKVQKEEAVHLLPGYKWSCCCDVCPEFQWSGGTHFQEDGFKGSWDHRTAVKAAGTTGGLWSNFLSQLSALRSDQAEKGFIQSGLENPQRWRVHHLSGQPVPLLGCPHRDKLLSSCCGLTQPAVKHCTVACSLLCCGMGERIWRVNVGKKLMYWDKTCSIF